MVLPWADAGIGVAATVALAAAAVAARALTVAAGAIAAIFGGVIVVTAGFPYLALLVLFVVAAVLATRYGLEEKQRRSVQEGVHGERGVSNVVAHILIPTAIAVSGALPGGPGPTETSVLFGSAIAFGAADTFASEFGVLESRAYSILGFRPVPAGTNGGVSALGTTWAATGAVTTAFVGFLIFAAFGRGLGGLVPWLVTVALAGFLACQVDSVVGELFENRGYLTKGGTNFVAMASAVGIGLLLWYGVTGLR